MGKVTLQERQNSVMVEMVFNNCDSDVVALQEVQEYCLKNKDLKTCADLLNKGYATAGSISFYIVKG